MAYGIDSVEIGHRVADLAHKILKGAKPADIPIFQPTKFELTINLRPQRALGSSYRHCWSAAPAT